MRYFWGVVVLGWGLVMGAPAAQEAGISDSPGCVPLADISSQTTPVGLYKAVAACVQKEDYATGSEIMVLAGTYGRFDMARVTDVSAHQAVTVLQMFALEGVAQDGKDAFVKAYMTYAKPDGPNHAQLCADMRAASKPNYTPNYMIHHGMAAYSRALGVSDGEEASPLVKDFDADKAWDGILRDSLHCS